MNQARKKWLRKNWFQIIQTVTIVTGFYFGFSANNISSKSISWAEQTYNQLLPLQTSNVVLKETDVSIQSGADEDIIRIGISNSGKGEAKNVCFRIYQAFIEGLPPKLLWPDCLLNELQPSDSANFGAFKISHISDLLSATGTVLVSNVNLRGRQNTWITHVEYQDSITGEKRDKLFFFQYTIGDTEVKTLLSSDYRKLYDGLKKAVETSDPWMFNNLPVPK